MKILFASTPASGHINPMFAIGQMLVAAGHEVVGFSASAMRDRIEAVRATFRAFPKDADFDLRNVLAVYPELANIPPGIEMSLFYSERVLIDPMRAQHEGLLQVLRDFPADVIIADNFLCGDEWRRGRRSKTPCLPRTRIMWPTMIHTEICAAPCVSGGIIAGGSRAPGAHRCPRDLPTLRTDASVRRGSGRVSRPLHADEQALVESIDAGRMGPGLVPLHHLRLSRDRSRVVRARPRGRLR